ncbi:Ribonuclease BN, tRNA processing enzyme [Paenibacillus sp. 1_12]|uniref:MBL fold metallo-hydrolase n=1 Tax=Paenibacillus sp. 1_12 TaxID=1566278 RepID=UPI0008EA1874|nr:MBL fold metallo-hydrolase [Paenibacillus sp. 1_12]SFL49192.1 Ribonuclease BN, tRNA processing enzyme [Paenibacillus sp. 1_12]
MSLQIQMIGTGSAFSKKFYNNNALVTCNGFTLLVDCGYTAPRALHELDVEINQINGLLITHIHADHVGGMEEFAFRLKYTYKYRMKLFVPALLVDSLWSQSLRGGLENKHEGFFGLEDYFELIVMEEAVSTVIHPGLTLELIRSEHIHDKPSYSLLINEKVFYSSDTKFNYPLLVGLRGEQRCQYILHDCQLSSPGIVHASLDELLTLPESIQGSVMLMHYDDYIDEFIGKTGKMTIMKQHSTYTFP